MKPQRRFFAGLLALAACRLALCDPLASRNLSAFPVDDQAVAKGRLLMLQVVPSPLKASLASSSCNT